MRAGARCPGSFLRGHSLDAQPRPGQRLWMVRPGPGCARGQKTRHGRPWVGLSASADMLPRGRLCGGLCDLDRGGSAGVGEELVEMVTKESKDLGVWASAVGRSCALM